MSEFFDSLKEDLEQNPEERFVVKKMSNEERAAKLNECLIEAVRKVAAWQNIDASRLSKQINVAINMINGIVLGHKNFIVDAPTGFGKSILGMLLNEMMILAAERKCLPDNKLEETPTQGSYILTPNKFLQDQYQSDIDRFALHKTYAQLKGQGNYACLEDAKETFATRPCHKIAIGKLPDKKECGEKCPYYVARKHAMHADATVFNYNYWLTSLNFIYGEMCNPTAPFQPRTLTVLDECHLTGKIVQDMFSRTFNLDWMRYQVTGKFNTLYNIYGAGLLKEGEITAEMHADVIKTLEGFTKYQSELLAVAHVDEKSKMEYEHVMKILQKVYVDLQKIASMFALIIESTFPDDEEDYSDQQIDIKKSYNELLSNVGQISAIKSLFDEIGLETMVVDHEEFIYRGQKSDFDTVKITCVKDADLIKRHVLQFTEYALFMSASIGQSIDEIAVFAETHGIENPYMIRNESDFNFQKSPIIMTEPKLNMSWKNKTENFPKLLLRIQAIMDAHKDQHGIIHTGNYEFMNKLKNYAEVCGFDNRIIWCTNARIKTEAVNQIKSDLAKGIKNNTVLAGPGLLEGLDMKDDASRFQILMKVPYQSMADELVKRKMTYYDKWYQWATMQTVIQAIGRGNRHKDDWCITYLVDGGFDTFFWRYGQVPQIINSRLFKSTLEQWFNTETYKSTQTK